MEHRIDYIELWIDDYNSLIDCAVRNMQSDLAAGYNPHGKSIAADIECIREITARRDAGIEHIADFADDRKASRWCYLDMKRRGAIS